MRETEGLQESTNKNVTNRPVQRALLDSIFSGVASGDRLARIATTEVSHANSDDSSTVPLPADWGRSQGSRRPSRGGFERLNKRYLPLGILACRAGAEVESRPRADHAERLGTTFPAHKARIYQAARNAQTADDVVWAGSGGT